MGKKGRRHHRCGASGSPATKQNSAKKKIASPGGGNQDNKISKGKSDKSADKNIRNAGSTPEPSPFRVLDEMLAPSPSKEIPLTQSRPLQDGDDRERKKESFLKVCDQAWAKYIASRSPTGGGGGGGVTSGAVPPSILDLAASRLLACAVASGDLEFSEDSDTCPYRFLAFALAARILREHAGNLSPQQRQRQQQLRLQLPPRPGKMPHHIWKGDFELFELIVKDFDEEGEGQGQGDQNKEKAAGEDQGATGGIIWCYRAISAFTLGTLHHDMSTDRDSSAEYMRLAVQACSGNGRRLPEAERKKTVYWIEEGSVPVETDVATFLEDIEAAAEANLKILTAPVLVAGPDGTPIDSGSVGLADRLSGGGEACDNCGRTRRELGMPTLRCCSRCGLAYYCSVECQTKHWKGGQGQGGGHKSACRKRGQMEVGDIVRVFSPVDGRVMFGNVLGPDDDQPETHVKLTADVIPAAAAAAATSSSPEKEEDKSEIDARSTADEQGARPTSVATDASIFTAPIEQVSHLRPPVT